MFGGFVFAALAILFPPPARRAVPGASFTPPPDRVPTTFASIASPPPGTPREGVIPYAGRKLPLPAGQWQELALVRFEDARPREMVLLGRWAGPNLTGLVWAMAPDAASQPSGLLQAGAACGGAGELAGEVSPPPADRNPFAHECWSWSVATLKTGREAEGQDDLMRRGLARLAELGVTVPDRMMALRYIRSSEFGWFVGVVYLPERPEQAVRADRATLAWAKRYVALLHRGYDGELAVGQPTPALPREPG